MTVIDRHSSVSDDWPTGGDKGSADKASTRSQAKARHTAGSAPEHFRVRRFDADRTDEELTFEEAVSSRPSIRQLFWIDVAGDLSSSVQPLASDLADGRDRQGRTRATSSASCAPERDLVDRLASAFEQAERFTRARVGRC
jgi:hypothetical protein